jgi:hypothetical protein
MLKLTITELGGVKLCDLDNGSMIFRSEGYTHTYDDMGQLATDLLEFAETKSTDGWDGDEPDTWQASDFSAMTQVIDDGGTFSGSGRAYVDLMRALVAKMDYDYFYTA